MENGNAFKMAWSEIWALALLVTKGLLNIFFFKNRNYLRYALHGMWHYSSGQRNSYRVRRSVLTQPLLPDFFFTYLEKTFDKRLVWQAVERRASGARSLGLTCDLCYGRIFPLGPNLFTFCKRGGEYLSVP